MEQPAIDSESFRYREESIRAFSIGTPFYFLKYNNMEDSKSDHYVPMS
jgi:hypothetical protein